MNVPRRHLLHSGGLRAFVLMLMLVKASLAAIGCCMLPAELSALSVPAECHGESHGSAHIQHEANGAGCADCQCSVVSAVTAVEPPLPAFSSLRSQTIDLAVPTPARFGRLSQYWSRGPPV